MFLMLCSSSCKKKKKRRKNKKFGQRWIFPHKKGNVHRRLCGKKRDRRRHEVRTRLFTSEQNASHRNNVCNCIKDGLRVCAQFPLTCGGGGRGVLLVSLSTSDRSKEGVVQNINMVFRNMRESHMYLVLVIVYNNTDARIPSNYFTMRFKNSRYVILISTSILYFTLIKIIF